MKPGTTGKEKLESKWETGIWVGVTDTSREKIIATPQGCLKVRSVKRKPVEDRWNFVELESMQGTPWEPMPGHPDREIKSRVIIQSGGLEEPPPREHEEPVPKRVYIRKRDVEKFGATAGCEGCKAAIRGGGVRPHTEECRARIEKAIKESEGKDNRVTRAYEKQGEWIAKQMEEAEKRKQPETREEEAIANKIRKFGEAVPEQSGMASSSQAIADGGA